MNYKMAIVDECGEVMAWMSDLTSTETEKMLNEHPEWQMRPIQL